MKFCIFDAAFDECLFSIVEDGILILEERFIYNSETSFSEIFSASIEKLNIKIKSFDCFVISSGPGSFIGIRAAAAFVFGLSSIYDIAIVCVNSMLGLFIESDDFVSVYEMGKAGIVYVKQSLKSKVYNFDKKLYFVNSDNIEKFFNDNNFILAQQLKHFVNNKVVLTKVNSLVIYKIAYDKFINNELGFYPNYVSMKDFVNVSSCNDCVTFN